MINKMFITFVYPKMILSEKNKRFCEEYIVDMNGTKAAIRAGYSKKTAQEQSSRLLSKVIIQDYITQLRDEQKKRVQIEADDVINELKALGFWDINDFVGKENKIKDISTLSRKTNKPVVGVKRTEETFKGKTTVTTEIKLANKRDALVDLGRHLGIFEKDNQQSRKNIKVTIK